MACADLFGPDRLVNPLLQGLWIPPETGNGRIIYVEGNPADTMFRLESGRRVPVEIRVSSGDRESTELYRRYCPPRERGPVFSCFQFRLFMRDGFNAADLADHVAAMGGRFDLAWDRFTLGSGRFAVVTLFSPDDLISLLEVPVAVDIGAAVPGDGTLQVRSGDTVVVVYKQPDGFTLQARRTVP